MKKLFVLLLVLALTLALFAACGAQQAAPGEENADTPDSDTPNTTVEVGLEAPDFELPLSGGGTFRLSDQRGKVVVINLWATWCYYCVAEMPELQTLAETYPDDLVVVAVNTAETQEQVDIFRETYGYSFLFAYNTDGYIGNELYPTSGIPYSVVVDRDGVIQLVHVGGGTAVQDYITPAVETAVAAAEK